MQLESVGNHVGTDLVKLATHTSNDRLLGVSRSVSVID